ncbi:cytochrome P450 [Trametopsis cervina]|nr:cytochrome P450 [Trametopsis cervina]
MIDDPTHFIFKLSTMDTLAVTVGVALGAHAIFKHWEPLYIPIVIGLLVVLPAALSAPLVAQLGILQGIACTFSIFWGTLVSSIVLYRISPFHPLAGYPGPIQAKISKMWMAWIVSQGKQHLYIERLHGLYGDIVRIGPNEVSIRDVSAILPLMGPQGWPKGPMWPGRTFHNPQPGIIGFRDQTEHARRRRIWNRALNTTALKDHEPTIAKRVDQLVEVLGSQKGTVDLAQWLSFFTYDYMCDIVFGGGSEMLRDGDKDGLWQNMKDGLDISQIYENIPWLSYYTRYIPGTARELKRFRAVCYERAERRYHAGATVKDLFYYLSNEGNVDKDTLPRSTVVSEGVIAVIAGSDTTSSALSNAFWSLLRHPECYKRLQAEVDHYYPPGEDALNPQHHAKMVYLDAVLNEVLRLYPVVPSGSQRSNAVGAPGKAFGPYYVPQGNQARIHFWSVQRDPRNFSNPETFYPERWLIAEGIQESSEGLVHNPNAFIPFSIGPANCAGKNLALQEMRMVMCHTMQKLNLQFESGWKSLDWAQSLQDRLVYRTGRLPVIIRRRRENAFVN